MPGTALTSRRLPGATLVISRVALPFHSQKSLSLRPEVVVMPPSGQGAGHGRDTRCI
jgi:hypothetical protein